MSKTFIDPESVLADPKGAFDMFCQAAKSVAPFDLLKNPGYRSAVVIRGAQTLNHAEASGLGLVPVSGSSRIAAFSYIARLESEWCEHWLLPNPCSPGSSNSIFTDLEASHIVVVGHTDTQYGASININTGDFVDINLEKGVHLNNLQKARHAGMSKRGKNISRSYSCPDASGGIAGAFNGLPPATVPPSPSQLAFLAKLTAILLTDYNWPPAIVTGWTRSIEKQISLMVGKPQSEVISTYGPTAAGLVQKARHGNNTPLAEYIKSHPTSFNHTTGLALDLRTNDHITDDELNKLIDAVIKAGGRPVLEPTSTGCFSISGRMRKGNTTRLDIPGKGKCGKAGGAPEHLHVTVPKVPAPIT